MSYQYDRVVTMRHLPEHLPGVRTWTCVQWRYVRLTPDPQLRTQTYVQWTYVRLTPWHQIEVCTMDVRTSLANADRWALVHLIETHCNVPNKIIILIDKQQVNWRATLSLLFYPINMSIPKTPLWVFRAQPAVSPNNYRLWCPLYAFPVYLCLFWFSWLFYSWLTIAFFEQRDSNFWAFVVRWLAVALQYLYQICC